MGKGRSNKLRRKSGGGVSLDISGDSELIEALSKISVGVRTKVLRRAMHKGMAVVTKAVEARSPARGVVQVVRGGRPRTYVRTGRMRLSWHTANGRTNSKWKVRVETRSGAGSFKGDSFYAAFYEFGTKHQPPRPTLTPAFDENKARALAIARAEILRGVESEIWWASFRKTSLGRAMTGAQKRYRKAATSVGKAGKRAARAAKRLRKRAAKSARRTTRRVQTQVRKTTRLATRKATQGRKWAKRQVKAANRAATRGKKSAWQAMRRTEKALAKREAAVAKGIKKASKRLRPGAKRKRRK